MHTTQRFWLVCLLLGLLWLSGSNSTITHAQDDEYRAQAEALLAEMTIPERVGQVFMVTFIGDTAPNNSDIAELITDYYIGGVSLRRENDNITGFGATGDVPRQVLQLNNDMQRLAVTGISSLPVLETDPLPEEEQAPTPTPTPRQTAVPLLIAITQEGNGHPHSHIQSGLTPLPSAMAIGATWAPAYAQDTGAILGQELAALGVNMLFGPSLDVLEDPAPLSPGDMGVRAFGGDPYWVGEMGRAFITGVHSGSNGRLAVIPKHFPGNGDSDRPINTEVPTVRKSLEQLKQIELAPFFAVANQADSNSFGVADGLLATHIRYQGFQGNIRATTNPVSFDPQALTTLMALPEFTTWRSRGGIIVSDALGVRSVERFYDVTEQEFPHRRVAKDAFLAGNDLLYLDSFVLGDGNYETELANVKDTITWFQERYVTDQVLQQRVDEAVLRILQLKLRLYDGDFSLENVLATLDNLPLSTADNQSAVVDLAQTAVTLISPNPEELAERIPSPPGIDDNLVIFTDVRTSQQCSTCSPAPLIAETALADNIIALYGPEASEQIAPDQIQSYAFTDLADFLSADGPIPPPPTPETTVVDTPASIPTPAAGETAAPTPTPIPTATPPPGYQVQEALGDANWLIFALLDGSQGFPTLTRFLAERPDLTRDRQIIVFAYNAPYFLDTTEISKLTAYFGVYSHTPAFVDASARALFQELPLSGASPVDIDGISYNLFEQTQPDPNQIIDLFLVESNEQIQDNNNQEPQTLFVGDTLRLQTSVIRDRNGNPVPDGTLVQFIQFDRVTGLVNIIRELPSENGVASLDYVLEARTGQFQITAVSGQATLSREVNIEIQGEEQVAISIPTLVPTPTATPTPTTTPTPAPTPTATPAPTMTPNPGPTADEPAIRIGLSDVSMLVSFFSGLLATATLGLLIGRQQQASFSRQMRWVLWGLLGALLLYNYFALGLPGTAVFTAIGAWAGLATTLLGGLLGFAIYLSQDRRTRRQSG